MRLWSLHPSLLDAKGLVAVWREGLLAYHVLQGATKGYTQHPQLQRFRAHTFPIQAITFYLHSIADEAQNRGYNFDRTKLLEISKISPIFVTTGQLNYEREHLLKKLLVRDTTRYEQLKLEKVIKPHPLFTVIDGDIEPWERMQQKSVQAWYVYILECADGSLYTGSTNNIEQRVIKHNTGKASKYTRSHLPVKLLYSQTCSDKSNALKREYEIKNLSRSQKLQLILQTKQK